MQHSALDLDASIQMVMAADLEDIWPSNAKAGQMEMETCSQTNQVLFSDDCPAKWLATFR